MICTKCGSGHENADTDQLCTTCFIKRIEKRVRKHLREDSPLKKGQRVVLVLDESKEAAMNAYLLPRIVKNLPLEIIEYHGKMDAIERIAAKHQADRVITPKDADDLVRESLNELLHKEKSERNSKELILLTPILDREVAAFTRLLKLTHKSTPNEHTRFDDLEERYPGLKFSLVKAKKELDEL